MLKKGCSGLLYIYYLVLLLIVFFASGSIKTAWILIIDSDKITHNQMNLMIFKATQQYLKKEVHNEDI